MKVDRSTFASTVGYTNTSGLGIIMWLFSILTVLFCVKDERLCMALTGTMLIACMYIIDGSYASLPKEVTIVKVRFGNYEEMSDFGGCYLIPTCWVTYESKTGRVTTSVQEPKGRIRKELVKWRNSIKTNKVESNGIS